MSCGVEMITAPVSGTFWAKVKWMWPVPGGIAPQVGGGFHDVVDVFDGMVGEQFTQPGNQAAVSHAVDERGWIALGSALPGTGLAECPLTVAVDGHRGRLAVCDRPGQAGARRGLQQSRVVDTDGRAQEISGNPAQADPVDESA